MKKYLSVPLLIALAIGLLLIIPSSSFASTLYTNTYTGYVDGASVVSYNSNSFTSFTSLRLGILSTTVTNPINNFLISDSVPTAPTPTPETIAVSPSTASVSVGTSFNATIVVNG